MNYNSAPHPPTNIAHQTVGSQATPVIVFFLALILLTINLFVPPEQFYDYHSYLLYIDAIYHFPPPDWFMFEGLTKAYLIFLRIILGTTTAAVVAAHYLLLPIFLVGFFWIFRKAPWESAIIAAALFAPQLGLITIRATPAYIICALAAMRAIEGRPWALRLTLIATVFHVSAFLTLIPIVVLKAQSRFQFKLLEVSKTKVIFTVAVIGGLAFLFAQPVFDFLLLVFSQVPYLSKYSAYAVGLADPATTNQIVGEPISANHYVFLFGVTVLFLATVYFEQERSRLKLFVTIAYLMYTGIFFAFSPVPAFRFVPFFALPILAKVKFSNGVGFLRGLAALPFMAVCLGVFIVQVDLVIE